VRRGAERAAGAGRSIFPWGVVVVLTYSLGGAGGQVGIQSFSLTNLQDDSPLLWVPLATYVIISAYVMRELYVENIHCPGPPRTFKRLQRFS
jgi:hypothetical protein